MEKPKIVIEKSDRKDKKYKALIDNKKTVYFGQAGFSDFTLHKNPDRKQLYINRHEKRENWNKSGYDTPGFYSRWILWNQPTLKRSIEDTNKKFNLNIKYKN